MKVLLIAILAIGFPHVLPPPIPTPAKAGEEKQQASSSVTLDGAPHDQSLIRPVESYEATINQGGKHGNKSSTDRWIMIFTGFLTLVGFLQVYAMFKQGSYMRKGLGLTKEAADAAKQSVQISNRARLVVDQMKFYDLLDEKKVFFRYAYHVINKGHTTARVFETLNCANTIKELPEEPPYEGSGFSTHVHIGPGQSVTFNARELVKADIDLANLDALYALGFVRYRDEFGQEWITRYARQYSGETKEPRIVQKAGYSEAT